MIIVIDYNLKNIAVSAYNESSCREVSYSTRMSDEIMDNKALREYICGITGKEKITAISFRILFGGDCFDGPALVNDTFFKHFDDLTGFFPFYVPATLRMIKRFREIFRDVAIIAFFETSFFSRLPDEEKYYALPFKYNKNNKIKKWGNHGIFHEANSKLLACGDKAISIVFDKQTTVCACVRNLPVSVSFGYTPLEGVMSRTSCGDLDPGIIFYLMNVHNFSMYAIDEMLKEKSGFFGLTGYDLEIRELLKLRGKDTKVDIAFDVYCAQIMKHIGEGSAALGGIDTMIFSGSYAQAFHSIIYTLVKKLSFLGITTVSFPWKRDKDTTKISADGSNIAVYLNHVPLPKIIFHETISLLNNK